MIGRQPASLLVESYHEPMSMSAWCDKLKVELSRVCDYVEMELSALDFVETEFKLPYAVGDAVMLRISDRRQKRQPAYEPR